MIILLKLFTTVYVCVVLANVSVLMCPTFCPIEIFMNVLPRVNCITFPYKTLAVVGICTLCFLQE